MRLKLLAAILGCLWILALAPASFGGGGGENLLMVVNPNDEPSLRIANAYAKLRAVPPNNIVFIAPPTMAGYPLFSSDYVATFLPVYVNGLTTTMSSRGIGNQIDYIATFGQPQTIGGSYYNPSGVRCSTVLSFTYALGLLTEFQRGMRAGQVSGYSYPSKDSTDIGAYYRSSELCQEHVPSDSDISGSNVNAATSLKYKRGQNSAIHHSTSYSAVDVSPSGYNYVQWYMAANTGNAGMFALSPSQIIANFQYTAAGDGTKPAGQYYYEYSGDPNRSTVRAVYWASVQKYMNANSIPWFQENGVTPHNRTDVRGGTFGGAYLTLPNGSTYLPGSYADNMTSNGGCYGTNAQTKDDKMLQTGAGCTAGTMTEPYSTQTRFTYSTVFIFSAEGSTLGEAHYKAIEVPDFDLFEGDMLSQAYADVPHVVFTSAPANFGTVSGTISIGVSAALVPPLTTTATNVGSLELFVDGLSKGTKSGASGTFSLSTTGLTDGAHEIRAVAYNNSSAQSQGYVLSNIVVNNQGRSIVAASASYEISWNQTQVVPVTVTPGTGTVSSVRLLCLGRTVASVTGSASSLSLTSSNLAYGENVIVPVAVFSDGSQVQGPQVVVTRDFLQPPGVSITPSSQRTPGFKFEFFGGGAGKTIATSSYGGTPTVAFTGTVLGIAPGTPINMPNAFLYSMSNTNVGLAVRVTTRMLVVTPGEYSFFFTTVWNNWDSLQISVDGFPVMGHEFWNGTSFDPMFSWYGTCDTTHSIYLPAGEHVVQVLLAEYQGSGSDGAANFSLWYRGPDGVSQPPGIVAQSTGTQFYTIPSYPLTVAGSPAFGGSAAVTGSQSAYPYGTAVQIVATPALGYQFTSWSLSGSGTILNATSATTTLTLYGADVVTANFQAINLSGTETAIGGAIVQTPSAGPYYTGQVVWITASANAGWRFTSWSATGATLSSSTTLSTSLTVLENFSLTALFTEIPYTVTTAAVPPAGGTVAYTPTGTHFINDVLSIQASPAPGYYFVSWTATGATLGANVASTTATVANNVSLTASFAACSYSGTETATNGTISLSSSGPYVYGQVITATESAQAGYAFGGWNVAGQSSSTLSNSAAVSTSLTVYNNFTLTASFTQIQYSLAAGASPGAGGTVTVTPSRATYHWGDTATISESASPGYTFASWTATGGTLGNALSGSTTLTVTGNVTLAALFSQNSYSGTDIVTGGTIIVSSSGPYVWGQVITVTASAQAGYAFGGWSLTGSCTLGDTGATSTTLTVYGNFTLTANFAALPYTVTAQVSPAGTGTVQVMPSQATYHYGDVVTIQGSASPGYQFVSWQVTGGTVDSTSTSQATLTVQGDVTLTAAFAGAVLVTIDPSSVTWNDATHIMTVQVNFTSSNGNMGNAIDFGAELYLTGTDAGAFTGAASRYRNKTGSQLTGLITGTFAFAAWDGKSAVQNETSPVGVDFYFNDYSWNEPVDLSTIAPGEVVAIYLFSYTGSHTAFTQVQAHLCAAGAGDDTQPGVIDLDDGGAPPVAATNNGVNLIPELLTVTAAASSAWVYQNTAGTTQDRHVVALTVSVTGDTFGNQSYTTTVTQTGPGVVTPTQSWTSGVLVTPASTTVWSVPVGGNLSGYLVGGRVSGPVNGSANLALTGSCTVTVNVAGNLGGTATATVVITVQPLGGIDGTGPVNWNDLRILDNCLNNFNITPQTDADCDLLGDGYVTTADRVLLNLIFNGLPVP